MQKAGFQKQKNVVDKFPRMFVLTKNNTTKTTWIDVDDINQQTTQHMLTSCTRKHTTQQQHVTHMTICKHKTQKNKTCNTRRQHMCKQIMFRVQIHIRSCPYGTILCPDEDPTYTKVLPTLDPLNPSSSISCFDVLIRCFSFLYIYRICSGSHYRGNTCRRLW